MLNETQQIQKLIKDSKHILLVFGGKHNLDAAGACLAFYYWLQKQQKQADIVCQGFDAVKTIAFLKDVDKIKTELARAQKFTIKLDVSHTQIDSLSYDVKDGWLSIYLTPKHGNINKENLRTAQSAYKYDLIITAGAPDLNYLGAVFLNNTDLFYNAPIINLDCHAANERFGQINAVDLSCSSVSEVVGKILKQAGVSLDNDIANALLTGMIYATNSFKNNNVTPQVLNNAGELMKFGADRENIVRHLYRNRTIATLKLWGYALSGLKNDQQKKLAWTTLTKENFLEAGAKEDDLNGVAQELINNSPEVEIAVIFYESLLHNDVRVLVYTKRHHDAKQLLKIYNPDGDSQHAWCAIKNKNIHVIAQELVEYIKQIN